MNTQVRPFATLSDGRPVNRIRISAGETSADILTLGATVHRLDVAGRNVVLGHAPSPDYLTAAVCTGATCGRVANRIAGGRFTIDGVEHEVATNERGNTLHGGPVGFDKAIWDADNVSEEAVELVLVSPDGDQGFPGEVSVRATFAISPYRLDISYQAVTTRPTPIALTNHAYFNLHGEGYGTTDAHSLWVDAESAVEVDADLLATGGLKPLDWPARPTPIGHLAPFDQCVVIRGQGFRRQALLTTGGLALEIWSDQPGLQVFSGDDLPPSLGVSGKRYGHRCGVALESQYLSGAVNQPRLGSCIVRPGETYRWRTSWRFIS